MAKTKVVRRRRNGGIKIPLALIGGFLPYLNFLREGHKDAGWDGVMKRAPQIVGYSGYTKKWSFNNFITSGAPGLLIGAIIHKVASRFGVNRAIANMGVPFIRI